MWKASAGQNVNIQSNGDDDDWETDPDFVVSTTLILTMVFEYPQNEILGKGKYISHQCNISGFLDLGNVL